MFDSFALTHYYSVDGLIRRRFAWYSVLNVEIYGINIGHNRFKFDEKNE